MRVGWQQVMGVLLLLSGMAWSPWAFDGWIGSGFVDDARLRGLLLALSGSLMLFGLAQFLLAPSRTLLRLDLLVLALCFLLPLAGEIALRVGIAKGRAGLREPLLYADPKADDDYWKMRIHWFGDSRVNPGALDRELGWSVPATPLNPLRVVTNGTYSVDPAAPAVLFFGDSFVAGPVAVPKLIPQLLDPLLPDLPVLNYGIGGYGLDQICLRVERKLPLFPQGIFIVGVMTRDLDRALLSVRSGQKPFAALEDGRLVIRGQPVDDDPAAWYARHPPEIKSFLAARLVQWNRRRAAGGQWVETSYRREEKRQVSTLLFERIVGAVRERGRPLLFVLFDPHDRIGAPGWREKLCRELCERLDVPWVDAGAALQREATARSLPVQSFFRPDNHPNGEANGIIAREVAAKLAELGWARVATTEEQEE